MKQRLLALGFLLLATVFVTLLGPEQGVRADACSDCYATYQSCYGGCSNDYDLCMSNGNGNYVCSATYQSCTGNCDEVYAYCQNANCGGGGPGGEPGVGYNQTCTSVYCGARAQCLDGSLFGSGFEVCEGLSGEELTYCCNTTFNHYVFDLQSCYCTPDWRVLSCLSYPACS